MMQQTELLSEERRLAALGQRLRSAREALQISEASAAQQLYLSTGQVRALEEASFAQLPGEVFVRGYLRSYARLLGLDQEDILRQYQPVSSTPGASGSAVSEIDRSSGSSAPASADPARYRASQGGGGNRSQKRPVAQMQARVRGLATRWTAAWQSALASATEALAQISDRTLMALSGLAIAVVVGTVALLLITGGEQDQLAEEGEAAPRVARMGHRLTADPALFEVVEEATRLDIQLPSAGDSDRQGADSAADAGNGAVHGEAVARKLLEIEFSADCWVEVKDSSRKILLADMRRAGDREIFQGEPPYKVLLGRVEAVAIRYEGKPVAIEAEEGKDYSQVVIGG